MCASGMFTVLSYKYFPTSIFCFELLSQTMSRSQAMEKEGIIQSLRDILENFQLDIEAITTDEQRDEMKNNRKRTYFKHQLDHCTL